MPGTDLQRAATCVATLMEFVMDTGINSSVEEKSDEPLDILRGAKEIGRFIGKKPGATNYALNRGRIPADREGAVFVSTKTRLREHYAGSK